MNSQTQIPLPDSLDNFIIIDKKTAQPITLETFERNIAFDLNCQPHLRELSFEIDSEKSPKVKQALNAHIEKNIEEELGRATKLETENTYYALSNKVSEYIKDSGSVKRHQMDVIQMTLKKAFDDVSIMPLFERTDQRDEREKASLRKQLWKMTNDVFAAINADTTPLPLSGGKTLHAIFGGRGGKITPGSEFGQHIDALLKARLAQELDISGGEIRFIGSMMISPKSNSVDPASLKYAVTKAEGNLAIASHNYQDPGKPATSLGKVSQESMAIESRIADIIDERIKNAKENMLDTPEAEVMKKLQLKQNTGGFVKGGNDKKD